MLIAVVLGLMVSPVGAKPEPVSIYVGPQVRDGFVDVDQGVRDSIKDIQGELRKDGRFRLMDAAPTATLKLYVMARTVAATGGSTGAIAQGTGVLAPDKAYRVETLLRVGAYEHAFVGQSEQWTTGTWKRCARLLVRDVATWLTANRERIAAKE